MAERTLSREQQQVRRILSILENYGQHHGWCHRTFAAHSCDCGFEARMNEITAQVWANDTAADLVARFDELDEKGVEAATRAIWELDYPPRLRSFQWEDPDLREVILGAESHEARPTYPDKARAAITAYLGATLDREGADE